MDHAGGVNGITGDYLYRDHAGLGNLEGLWGSGASDIWAVGQDGVILHWEGTSWSAVASSTGSVGGALVALMNIAK